jgi:predicted nucleotidyltransferase
LTIHAVREIVMKGIKKHTRSDRWEIIKKMTPLIRKRFGDNLVALAVCGSCARGDDAAYSDLELVAFVKKMPRCKRFGGFAKIYDGMLIELIWMTRKQYIENALEPKEEWHMSGSDVLVPIINRKFIEDLQAYEVKNLKRKCLDHAVGAFSEYQESVTKILNAINQKNKDGIPLLLLESAMQFLKVLSFLNQTPYITFSRFISQARQFAIKPKSSDKFIDIIVDGEYGDLRTLRRTVIAVFSELERIFEELGLELYDDNFDPNIPVLETRSA